MKRKIRFIINPHSGIRRKSRIPVLIEKIFSADSFDIDIQFTEFPGHATELSKQAVDEGFDTVVAVGGDGSINETARELIDTNVKLGIVPHGSGNGLARYLNIPLNPKKALELIKNDMNFKIDCGTCNNQFFFSNFGVGFDVQVAKQFGRHKIRGFLSYSWAVIYQFYFKYKPIEIIITEADKRKRLQLFLMTVFNTNQYGFNIGLAPNAKAYDGNFDVAVVKPFHKFKLLFYGLAILLKKTNWVKDLHIKKEQNLVILNLKKEKMLYQIDGEVNETKDNLIIGIKKQALNVIGSERFLKKNTEVTHEKEKENYHLHG
ncbi:MAG: diacylglycerol kinase family lipid kinase [Chitinophagaceae bacterium]|nr:MAG: diacylglycerol kinase family lipid kinase [Chitinophagaceae bacterium]